MKLIKPHLYWILSLFFQDSRPHHWGPTAGKVNLFLRLWTSGWKNRDFLQKQPLWTFRESEASHLQLHLDSVDGQDFILERENRKIKLLNHLHVIQQLPLSLSPSILHVSTSLWPYLMNLPVCPPEDWPPWPALSPIASLCLCSSWENLCSPGVQFRVYKWKKTTTKKTHHQIGLKYKQITDVSRFAFQTQGASMETVAALAKY